jgi:mannobiose 2-epimerase
MHLMEAFTTLTELTACPRHRQALEAVTDLIFARMTDPLTGTGISMFAPDWTPIPNLQLGTLWGSDRFDPAGKPPAMTSYGHNIELAWLYLHSLTIRGQDRRTGLPRTRPIFEHTLAHGVDPQYGGLFTEGHRERGATETNKEFWQQAEALVGFLDAFELTGEERYWQAFQNIHDFVFKRMIHWEQGEWFPLLARDGTVLWDYMGHNWKICYHTIRSMCEVIVRLRRLA